MATLTATSVCQAAALRTLAEGGALHLLPDLAASPGGPPAYICAAAAAAPGTADMGVATPPAEVWGRFLLMSGQRSKPPHREFVM